jgi:hypothetical protein
MLSWQRLEVSPHQTDTCMFLATMVPLCQQLPLTPHLQEFLSPPGGAHGDGLGRMQHVVDGVEAAHQDTANPALGTQVLSGSDVIWGPQRPLDPRHRHPIA